MIQATNKIEIDEKLFEMPQLPDVKELTVTEQDFPIHGPTEVNTSIGAVIYAR